MPPEQRYLVAIDIGGTFTDMAAFDRRTGAVHVAKQLTDYPAFFDSIGRCLEERRIALEEAESFKHGTTLVINALLERSGARTALVATRGFRDVVEIGRGNRPLQFELEYRRREPLVPRELRFEIDERIGGDGAPITPPREADAALLAERLRDCGAEAVAVSFINAYANDAHEVLVAGWLRERLPGVFVCTGSELTREWYEYERGSTACANAFVGPQMGRYAASLDAILDQRGFRGKRFFMGSGAGAISLDQAARQPIRLVESGPVGGLVGAAAYARALGIAHMVALDVGGTTAKCALVKDGTFEINTTYWVGGYARGTPIRSSIIDIVEVGAGGGSIAYVDEHRRLHVGPRSAGSNPGPVAYGRGGSEPTLTDANVVLGRINPENFLGDGLHLDVDAVHEALRARVAAPLGMTDTGDVTALAAGILTISSVLMAGAIRKVTVERGEDPRDFVLFAYGGGGPLHAVELAREIGIPEVVIPPRAGIFAALGMLFADLENDAAATVLLPLDEAALPRVRAALEKLEAEAIAGLGEQAQGHQCALSHSAELRYKGQMHSLKIPLDVSGGARGVRATFEKLYARRFGHASSTGEVEFVGLGATARLATPKPALSAMTPAGTKEAPVPGRRRVYVSGTAAWTEVAVYQRAELAPGFSAQGPAVIEDFGCTCFVDAGTAMRVGEYGELRLALDGAARPQEANRGRA
ncbi:MAG: hydantoinase/oxoprolinase family protein [Burkholderiales bacterium]|nr:hydantoinase/oxoprolinase family protein [Burkholderiales bacterium]